MSCLHNANVTNLVSLYFAGNGLDPHPQEKFIRTAAQPVILFFAFQKLNQTISVAQNRNFNELTKHL